MVFVLKGFITELVRYGTEGCVVDSELAGLLAVSIIFSAIAVVEALIIFLIFYSMASIILAMLGYFALADRLGKKELEGLQQEKE